ncbi:MAG: phosphoribosylglycinamide formyltransferase [Alphaproteobacteria bacterium]|nr:phosphoribosylglycinamide formyltransferase [Alphaproteobacteria bacterium]
MARLSRKRTLGVLISGRGSNLKALLDACAEPDFPARIAVVLSNRAGAPGLEHAARVGVPTQVIDHRTYPDRDGFDAALDAALCGADVELVCLAGFMRLLTPGFCATWAGRMINIHPSLLPAFKGLNAQAQALAAGVRIAGCTVHYVRAETDGGPIVLQAAAPVLPADDEAALSARILALEHRLYPQAVRLIAEGRVKIDGGRCIIEGLPPPLGLA